VAVTIWGSAASERKVVSTDEASSNTRAAAQLAPITSAVAVRLRMVIWRKATIS
jgi:hypothetical protein